MKRAFVLMTALCLAACAAAPQAKLQPLPRPEGYGPPPPADYRKQVEKELGTWSLANLVLGEGPSVYEFWPPVKTDYTPYGHVRNPNFEDPYYRLERKGRATWEATLVEERVHRGWLVCGKLTQRDSLAGYATYEGPMPFYAFFQDGRLVDSLISRTADETLARPARAHIYAACAQAGMPPGK